jgi:fructose-1,6-bisphosphatase/inositol monophosphatase family enzyme
MTDRPRFTGSGLFSPEGLDQARMLLCELGNTIRQRLHTARSSGQANRFAAVSAQTSADTIYHVDKLSEEAIQQWFEEHWPKEWVVEVVMEGIEEETPLIYPAGAPLEQAIATCILDPIDGTRGLMHDKRSAWALAALAPRRHARPRLGDILVAAMTELPPSKQTLADQLSAVKDCGRAGVLSQRTDLSTGKTFPFRLSPSTATDFRHGFASFAKFFPEGKSLMAHIEEELWDELYGLGATASPVIFDDQYISTGGQIYELLVGHDRMVADLRPRVLAKAGFESSLVCHPYDICTGLLLIEAGCILEHPDGGPVDAPLDTTSPVTWIGYANADLARQVRPLLQRILEKHLA